MTFHIYLALNLRAKIRICSIYKMIVQYIALIYSLYLHDSERGDDPRLIALLQIHTLLLE